MATLLSSIKWKPWLYASVVIFVITSIFSLGYNQSDEHFQILEFAGLKLGINTELDLAWEYQARMRPAIQPGMVVLLHQALDLIGVDNPFLISGLLRLLSAIFTIIITVLLYQTYRDRFTAGHQQWAFFLFSFFLWFGFYNGVRFNSEMWSANTFALAVVLFLRWRTPSAGQYLALGLLVGLSFLFRYQAAFMIAGMGLWLIFIQREKFGKLISFTLGGLLMVGVGVLIDRWFYGEWVLSTWHYFEQNILLDKASTFGVDPWWQYFYDTVLKGIPPFGLLYLAALLFYLWKRPKDLISWITVPFIGIHLLIAHKEIRFLYVLLPFLPIALSTLLQALEDRTSRPLWTYRGYCIGWRIFWIHNALLTLFIMFWPVIMEIKIYQTVYYNYEEPITVYGVQDNPYRIALYINYYKRNNVCTAEVDSLDKLPRFGEDPYIIAVDRRYGYDIEGLPGKKTLIHSTYPQWVHTINFNNWLGRSQWWLVYEVRN
ncbi:MAG: glycosyltransferase family 39 protein [Bacteroidota bacterium]